jgi:hypothetical protein
MTRDRFQRGVVAGHGARPHDQVSTPTTLAVAGSPRLARDSKIVGRFVQPAESAPSSSMLPLCV